VQIVFNILSWGAWSPHFLNKEDWQLWPEFDLAHQDSKVSPSLSHIPAMQRRRFSLLTKMMLSAAHDSQPAENCRSIFASRHGELTRTLGLLQDITAEQALSPTAFSQSVHNTASGIFGILNNNTSASTSIAAAEQTLPQALIEAYGQLTENPEPLLLVFGDDPIPQIYSEFVNETEFPFAMALVLAPDSKQTSPSTKLTLTNTNKTRTDSQENISFHKLMHHIATAQNLNGTLCHWHWSVEHDGH
jgi:hypothetical protein